MKYLFLTILFLSMNSVYALPEKLAGELCGGWDTTGRTELDDEVFFECVETKMKNKPFDEKIARTKHARIICSRDKGSFNACVKGKLSNPSRLAIKTLKKRKKGRNVASKKKKK